ncbi:MAG: hypothetical protein GY754_20725, partial [bacterium]|nr:hypothetical protein [bacterium]
MNFSKCSLLYTLISALSLSALLALTGCFSNNMGTISIDLGSGNNTGSKASQAPSNITQFTLKISSPGMNTIEGTYPAATSEISIEVPAGNNRLIELTSDINPSDPGAVLSYKGSSLVNLNSGETKTVILSMKVNETKLIIPDFGNNRVIQVTSLSGDTTAINAAWQDLTAAGAGWSLRPGDVDFDSQGRIYIASAYGGSGDTNNCVVRVDNIAGDNSIKFASASYDNGVEALAVDRNN